jgi:hypothetical protein
MAQANEVLLDSIVTQSGAGTLILGRGLPATWVEKGKTVSVTHFETTGGHHLAVSIEGSGRSVRISLSGSRPAGPVKLELPWFRNNVDHTSRGTVDEATGTVTVQPSVRNVTVVVDHAP